MDGLSQVSVRPVPLQTFDEAHMRGSAAHLRKMAADIARLSWDMDEALRNVRRAQSPTEKAGALTYAREVSERVAAEMLALGYHI